jgi:hypothetical protein
MAGKCLKASASKRHTKGHEDCPVCGTCLMFAAQIHRCPKAVDPDVLEVFMLDSHPKGSRATRPSRSPLGFQEWDGDSY